GFYRNEVDPSVRSRMNVAFFLHDEALDQLFLDQARQAGLISLKGHRVLGGMRAAMYNAMPVEGVQALAGFMRDFQKRHGYSNDGHQAEKENSRKGPEEGCEKSRARRPVRRARSDRRHRPRDPDPDRRARALGAPGRQGQGQAGGGGGLL